MVTSSIALENEINLLLSPYRGSHWFSYCEENITENRLFPSIFVDEFSGRARANRHSEGNNPVRTYNFEIAGEMFRLLKLRLFYLSTAERVSDDSYDYITTWQIVSMMLLSLYSKLLHCYVKRVILGSRNKNRNRNRNHEYSTDSNRKNNSDNYSENSDDNNDRNGENSDSGDNGNGDKIVFLALLLDYYETLKLTLQVLTVRVRYTRWFYIAEYVTNLASITRTISIIEESSLISHFLRENKRAQVVRDLKCEISKLFSDLLQFTRDSGE